MRTRRKARIWLRREIPWSFKFPKMFPMKIRFSYYAGNIPVGTTVNYPAIKTRGRTKTIVWRYGKLLRSFIVDDTVLVLVSGRKVKVSRRLIRPAS